MIKRLTVDDRGRLHCAKGSDWFTLHLDLVDNREQLCRYLAGLGSRMLPEVKARYRLSTLKAP
jgi:hypothetical protein